MFATSGSSNSASMVVLTFVITLDHFGLEIMAPLKTTIRAPSSKSVAAVGMCGISTLHTSSSWSGFDFGHSKPSMRSVKLLIWCMFNQWNTRFATAGSDGVGSAQSFANA